MTADWSHTIQFSQSTPGQGTAPSTAAKPVHGHQIRDGTFNLPSAATLYSTLHERRVLVCGAGVGGGIGIGAMAVARPGGEGYAPSFAAPPRTA